MIPSLFLRHLLDLQKNFQIIHQILIFSPKIWQLLCVNIFIETQVRSYQKSIRVSLEKMAGAHRSFFLGYKDAYKKLTFMQGFFTPDIKFILVREMCFHVMVVIGTKPKVKGELQTVIENFANL